jgi:uncharacterized repeat protein (TIGR02543 family)
MRNHGGEDGTIVHSTTVTVPATTITDFPANPTRPGYNFAGWTTLPGGGDAFVSNTTVSGTITVYAQWTGKTYTVTFKLNDGTDVTHTTITVTVPATTIDALPANPTRPGYNFAGWNTQAGGGGDAFTGTTTVNGTITVYAQWVNGMGAITLELDAGNDTFTGNTFILPRIGGTGSQTLKLASGYTNPRWFVDGDLKTTGDTITINAADYDLGGHRLTLLAARDGVSWSREITFTVVANE